jgi:hypothetical protein
VLIPDVLRSYMKGKTRLTVNGYTVNG